MSIFLTIARPYAIGAFDFAVEKNNVTCWFDMLKFAAEVSKDVSVIRLFSCSLSPSKIAEIFIHICEDKLDVFFCNFIKIMASHGRLVLLPFVFDYFSYLRNLQENIVTAELFSANILSNDCIYNIEKIIRRKFKCIEVNLITKLDKSIISGFVIRVNSTVIDCSLRGRLELFRKFLSFN